ncbi:MAG: GGDEF domain-containing protein [Burkholderiaceae bacterium]|nr:GGDEF domain-containing protein [Burkholderiaceae bacterium]
MNALLQLACFQMLIYAGMWAAGWVIVGEERRSVLHWLGFNLLVAAGMGLTLLRPTGDPWLTVALANVLIAGAFLLLVRGGALFLRRPTRDLELGLIALAGLAFVLWTGPAPRGPGWIHPGGAATAVIAWSLLSMCWRDRAALAEQFGPRTAAVALAPMALYGGLQAWRTVQIFTRDASFVHIQSQSTANELLVYASLLAAAVFNLVFMFLIVLRLMGRLTYLVEHDGLTGLLNRRAIQSLLEREWARWRRLGEPFTVVALDLDHFKQINDRWGHPAGDEVLRSASSLLRREVRSIDAVGRVGGEEFLVLMPGCAPESAVGVAERLRRSLRGQPVAIDGGREVAVTASLGVAAVDAGDPDLEHLMRRADAALYQAKHEGRDRVVRAQAPRPG